MRYKQFEVQDEDAVNKFLTKHSPHVSRDGTAFLDGKICFLYNPDSDEEVENEGIKAAITVYINQQLTELMSADVDHRYWTSQELKGREVADKVAGAKQRIEQHQIHIRYARALLTEVGSNKWEANNETRK